VEAEVTLLIGIDFLCHFGLLVACNYNRLLEEGTSLSVLAQAGSSLIPSVKTISGGIPIDTIIAEFPDLTHPTRVQREVRHNNINHVWTLPGPPATCRPR
jgi:hypothetical protein